MAADRIKNFLERKPGLLCQAFEHRHHGLFAGWIERQMLLRQQRAAKGGVTAHSVLVHAPYRLNEPRAKGVLEGGTHLGFLR